jgi:tRNA (guanine-N1)-methyltransferase
VAVKPQLFDDQWWLDNLAPHLEHPHYTRPDNWQNYLVPEFLRSGNHKKIQDWRLHWWQN